MTHWKLEAMTPRLCAVAAGVAAQPPVSIGTNPGSVMYAVGSGITKVVSETGKVKMAVQPYTGSSTFIPLLNSSARCC
jgi:hypothetical protein